MPSNLELESRKSLNRSQRREQKEGETLETEEQRKKSKRLVTGKMLRDHNGSSEEHAFRYSSDQRTQKRD